jgi:hypothetical protein
VKRIFISHSADNDSVELAHYLSQKLRDFGVGITSLHDSVESGHQIKEAVQDVIKQCSVVIALVTKASANVFYEMGYAEGIGKKIIILRDAEIPLPSDLRSVPMIAFNKSDSSFIYPLMEILEEEVATLGEDKPDNLLRDNPERVFDLYREHRGSFERIDNKTFEEIVRRLFQKHGFQVELYSDRSPASFDFAVEGLEGAKRVVVEVKKYNSSGKISVGQVQQLLGAVVAERADFGVMISPSEYTRTAVDFVSRCKPKVELWNMEELARRLHLPIRP